MSRSSTPIRPSRPLEGTARAGSAGGGLASSRRRFQLRAAQVRRRPWRLAGWATGTLALLVALVWVVFFSSLLAVRTVAVDGVPQAEQPGIAALAAIPPGTPLARVDADAVVHRVSQRPTVSRVSVQRSWPSTIVIHATPRVPALIIRNPRGQLQVVDPGGVVYATVSAPPRGVPVATAASDAALSKDALTAALSVVTVLPESLRAQVHDVRVTGADLVTFALGRTTVVWGGAAAPHRKLAIVEALLRGRPALVDVSAPDTPVTRG